MNNLFMKWTTIRTSIQPKNSKFQSVTKKDIVLDQCLFFFDEDEGYMIPVVIEAVSDLGFIASGCNYSFDTMPEIFKFIGE